MSSQTFRCSPCPTVARARLRLPSRRWMTVFAADLRPAVLVTGSSTGIGRTTTLHLANKGWQVFAGVRKPAHGEALVRDAPPSSVVPVLLDVTSDASTTAAIHEVATALGGRNLAGLVNNAGRGVFMPLELIPMSEFDDVMAVNVSGVVRVTQAALPLLRKTRPEHSAPGRIVNIGSYAGTIALPLFGAYAASKFGLEALSDVMRYELGPKWGIQTVLVKASGVKTPIWDKSIGASEAALDRVDPGALAPYREMCTEVMNLARTAEETGITTEEVAATIEEALTSPNPRSRFLIGKGAELQMTVRRLLPDWVWDRLLLGILMKTNKP